MGGLDVTAGNEDEEESDGDSLFGDEDGKGKDNHQTAEEDDVQGYAIRRFRRC